ncbi:hypothetical protein [Methanobrevibacter sp.]|uniref:hypothetical protein n=1 Tax=Methanobrevibacter sp. TaxID=66852 RepID=UPI00388F4ACA
MNISKKLLALLAIFCIIASVGVAFAAEDGGYAGSNYAATEDYSQSDDGSVDNGGDYAGSNYEDGGYAGSNYEDEGGWAGSQYNETLENQTAENQTAGNVTNTTNSTPVAQNTTTNSSIPDALHNLLATGNPILILLIVVVVLVVAAVILRRR